MSTTTLTPPDGPRWRDARRRRAGYWAKAAGTTKAVANAIGRSPRRVRQINDGCRTGAPQRTREWLEALARHSKTHAETAVADLWEFLEEIEAELMEPEELNRQWRDACTRETRKQGRVDLLQLRLRECPRDRDALEGMRELAGRQALHLLRLSALAGALLRRSS